MKPWTWARWAKYCSGDHARPRYGNCSITPLLFNSPNCSLDNPNRPANTSSVCWPNIGAGRTYSTGVPDILIGLPTMAKSGFCGWGIFTISSRAITCGSSRDWAMLLIAPTGTFEAWIQATHSSAVRPRKCADNSSTISAR